MLEFGYNYLAKRQGVWVNGDWFPLRFDEPELPLQRAWCKNCRKESAKAVCAISMYCKPGYVLECTDCGGIHHMYKYMFNQRYVGSNTYNKNGKIQGRIEPTHGIRTIRESMDRRTSEYYNDRHKRVEEQMCQITGWTSEQYREHRAEWDKQRAKAHNEFEAKFQKEMMEKEVQKASDERKRLIAEGKLVFKKRIWACKCRNRTSLQNLSIKESKYEQHDKSCSNHRCRIW